MDKTYGRLGVVTQSLTTTQRRQQSVGILRLKIITLLLTILEILTPLDTSLRWFGKAQHTLEWEELVALIKSPCGLSQITVQQEIIKINT